MRGLLVKDFEMVAQQKQFFIIWVAIAIIFNLQEASFFAVWYLTFASIFLVIWSVSNDDGEGCFPFWLTLPISRSTYVKEKYVFAALLGTIVWCIGMAIDLTFQQIHHASMNLPEVLMSAVLCLAMFAIILAGAIPATLKFGNEKGRMALMALCGGLAAVVFALLAVAKRIGIDVNLLIASLSNLHIGVILLLLLLFTGAACALSIRVSCRIMEKREF